IQSRAEVRAGIRIDEPRAGDQLAERDEAVDCEAPFLGAASHEHLSAQLVDGPACEHTCGDPAIEDTVNGREEPLAARWRREIRGFLRRQPHVVRPRGALDVREARWPK